MEHLLQTVDTALVEQEQDNVIAEISGYLEEPESPYPDFAPASPVESEHNWWSSLPDVRVSQPFSLIDEQELSGQNSPLNSLATPAPTRPQTPWDSQTDFVEDTPPRLPIIQYSEPFPLLDGELLSGQNSPLDSLATPAPSRPQSPADYPHVRDSVSQLESQNQLDLETLDHDDTFSQGESLVFEPFYFYLYRPFSPVEQKPDLRRQTVFFDFDGQAGTHVVRERQFHSTYGIQGVQGEEENLPTLVPESSNHQSENEDGNVNEVEAGEWKRLSSFRAGVRANGSKRWSWRGSLRKPRKSSVKTGGITKTSEVWVTVETDSSKSSRRSFSNSNSPGSSTSYSASVSVSPTNPSFPSHNSPNLYPIIPLCPHPGLRRSKTIPRKPLRNGALDEYVAHASRSPGQKKEYVASTKAKRKARKTVRTKGKGKREALRKVWKALKKARKELHKLEMIGVEWNEEPKKSY